MKKNDREREWKQRAIGKAEDNFNVVKSINTLHIAISNIDIKSITRILDIAEGAGSTALSELLLSHSESGETALHKAVKVGNDVIVRNLLRRARNIEDNKDTLTKLLLSTNILGDTALHCAAEMQLINDVIPRKLLNFARRAAGDTLTKLLLSLDNLNETALHKAVAAGNNVIARKLLRNAEAIADNNYTLTKLLLSLDNLNETALHKAVAAGNDVIAQKLLRNAEAIADNNYTLTKLLLSLDNSNKTALHKAVAAGNNVIVQKLLHKAGAIADSNYTLTKLLLSLDNSNKTALHYVAINGNSGILITLVLAAENITDSNIVLTKLLLSLDIYGEVALDYAINGGNTHIAKMLLLTTAYVGKLSVSSNESGSITTLENILESNDISNFIGCLQDDRNTKYIETHTLKELLSRKETIAELFCTKTDADPLRSKRSTHKELGDIIDQDSSDNPANKENENLDTKSDGWLKWLNDSLQIPTIFKGTEDNDIPGTSNVDRDLEIVDYNTNYTAANSSSRPLIGNDINNQETVPSITSNAMLVVVVLLRSMLKTFGLNIPVNISLGNNYTSPEQEHKMKVEELVLDISRALQMHRDLFGDDVSEDESPDSVSANSSSTHLQGNIQENEHQ